MASQMDEMDRDAGTRPVRAQRTTVVRGQTPCAFVPLPWHRQILFKIWFKKIVNPMSRAAASPTRRPGM